MEYDRFKFLWHPPPFYIIALVARKTIKTITTTAKEVSIFIKFHAIATVTIYLNKFLGG